MTWNYRLVRVPLDGEDVVCVVEVYYEGETITSWCQASAPQGGDRDEYMSDVLHMMVAASKPIIAARDLPGWPHDFRERGAPPLGSNWGMGG